MNSIGERLRLTTFGESHGPAIGGVLDGYPAGIHIDFDYIASEMSRRRPGQSRITTGRHEQDEVEFLSGILDGVSTGTPIAFIIRNNDCNTADYDELRYVFRPSHADYTYQIKYGIRDWRGGGRASGRVTIPICVAGALARLALEKRVSDLDIYAFTSQIGDICTDVEDEMSFSREDSEASIVRCPDADKSAEMEDLLWELKQDGDSIGGMVTCIIRGCPAGVGEPVFDKLHARLGAAMLGINAVKGFEYGDGFGCAAMRGSECNDAFITDGNDGITTLTNHSGGIQGGISNGQPIRFRVAFKPTPTIAMSQQTVTVDGVPTTLEASGRHDPCIVPRAVPVVENLAALVLADFLL